MNALHEIMAALSGLKARALLHKALLATALVAFVTVAIPIAGAVSGHGYTPVASADPECEDGDEECKAQPTKTPDDEEEEPTKTPEEEKATKTPEATPTATPMDTATPTDVPTDTPENTPTNTPVVKATPTDIPPEPTAVEPTTMPTDMPEEPVALPDAGAGFGPDLILSWYWYVLVGALLLVGLGVLIKPSYD